jgi:hypothetical protein
VFFKIKKTTALKKLMDAFCEKMAIATNSVRFLCMSPAYVLPFLATNA